MATKQETFDVVARHLLTQNAKSEEVVNGRRYCRYRGDEGRRCAVGVLIPDDIYSAEFEGRFADELGLLLPSLGHDVDLCVELQHVHDCENGPRKWPAHLRSLAERYGLSAAVLDEVPT